MSEQPKRRTRYARKAPPRKGPASKAPPRPGRKAEPSGFDDRDPMGRMALFSEIEPQEPATGWLWIECSSCLKETAVSPLDLVKATLPFSLHLPFRRPYHSLMRCPACKRRTWVRIVVRP